MDRNSNCYCCSCNCIYSHRDCCIRICSNYYSNYFYNHTSYHRDIYIYYT
nr:MAG TPA: hypothetical protein [Bacteriophage sp.]